MLKIYEVMGKIKGRIPRKINILHEGGVYYSTIPDIANRMVDSFSNVSSNLRYSPEFQSLKIDSEQYMPNFNSDNTEVFNSFIKMRELEYALMSAGNTTPGDDQVNYQMLKQLNSNSKNIF